MDLLSDLIVIGAVIGFLIWYSINPFAAVVVAFGVGGAALGRHLGGNIIGTAVGLAIGAAAGGVAGAIGLTLALRGSKEPENHPAWTFVGAIVVVVLLAIPVGNKIDEKQREDAKAQAAAKKTVTVRQKSTGVTKTLSADRAEWYLSDPDFEAVNMVTVKRKRDGLTKVMPADEAQEFLNDPDFEEVKTGVTIREKSSGEVRTIKPEVAAKLLLNPDYEQVK